MAAVSPIAGALDALDAVTEIFIPRVGRGFNFSVDGTFTGTVALERQLPGDDADTWRIVATWTEPVETDRTEHENGAKYRARMSAFTSGTANVRFGQ